MAAHPANAAVAALTSGVRLGAGSGGDLADPETVQLEKDHYANDLEEQLKRGMEVLAEMHKQQTEDLHTRANQERMRYNLAMDQQVKQRELLLSQEYNEQLMRLQQAAQAKRAELEQQATGLTLEFQQRKVQEEFMVQQLGIQKQHQEAQQRLAEEMQKLGLQQGPPGDLSGRGLVTGLTPNAIADPHTWGLHGHCGQVAHPAGLAPYTPGPGVAVPCSAPSVLMAAPPRPHSSRSASAVRGYAAPAGRGCAVAPAVTLTRSALPSAGGASATLRQPYVQ